MHQMEQQMHKMHVWGTYWHVLYQFLSLNISMNMFKTFWNYFAYAWAEMDSLDFRVALLQLTLWIMLICCAYGKETIFL